MVTEVEKMQKFTKTEIEWIIDELDRAVVDLK